MIQRMKKTYNKTCVTSKDSDQPVHLVRMPRVRFHTSLASPEAVEGTCDQQTNQTVRTLRAHDTLLVLSSTGLYVVRIH